MRRLLPAVAGLACLALVSCASGPRPPMSDVAIERALRGAPGEAQPSRIVAVELAFARAARDEGQWTAFRRFAAPGAILHVPSGGIVAEPWLARQSDPETAVKWAPREIWMSCDATLAISAGRMRDAQGKVGSFVTVWQRQSDGEYRWIYDTGSLDDPQPPPRPEAEDGDIVVTGLDAVRGHVGACDGARDGNALPAPPVAIGDNGGLSADGTLWWQWTHEPDGRRRFASGIIHDGAWSDALLRDIPRARRTAQ